MKTFTLKHAALSTLFALSSFTSNAWATKDVTIAVEITLDSLDPYNTNSTLAQAVGKGYYEGLLAFDKDLNIKPIVTQRITAHVKVALTHGVQHDFRTYYQTLDRQAQI